MGKIEACSKQLESQCIVKTLIVVSGGDAPGINALIAQFVRQAWASGDAVVGADGGFPGLIQERIVPLKFNQLVPWVGRGGSILPSSRDPVLRDADAQSRIRKVLDRHRVDNLLLFGGNGTLRYIPPLLQEWGLTCIGIPTTIDNDVPGTERSLGFDSACCFAYQAVDGALATAHALEGRIFLLETLGGGCGNLALAIANGAGAHAVILPEFDYDLQALSARTRAAVERFGHALIVVSEGAREARSLADQLAAATGIRVRDIRLGHAQRGGSPSHVDRELAANFARAAFGHLRGGSPSGTMVVSAGGVRLHAGLLPDQVVLPDRTLYDHINDLAIQVT